MKTTLAFLLVGLSALALGGPAPANVQRDQHGMAYRVADRAFLERQRDILRLLRNVFQPNQYEEQAAIARSWSVEQHQDQWRNQQVVQEFLNFYQQGFLPRGEVFSIMYENQRRQAVALAQLMYYAREYNTFYSTACWAREYMNEGMFVYALNIAVLHREDCQGMVLPAIYEVIPYYFVNGEVIEQAYQYGLRYRQGQAQTTNQNAYYIQANYSGWYLNADPEQYELSYFTEDVGLNAFYYNFNIDYPSWMGGEEFGLNNDRRGELFFYMHQQLLARYYLERLSHGYGSIPAYNWWQPIRQGYQTTLRYSNGMQFASRPAWSYLAYNPHNQAYTRTGEDNQYRIEEIEDFERRIRDAIDSGYIFGENGRLINIYENNQDFIDVLGRIIDSNPDSPNRRFYGPLQYLARQVLGYSAHSVAYNQSRQAVNPSVLEQYETSLRDPMFYSFYRRIMSYFLRYRANLPNYTRQQLALPGVSIQNVEVDRLVTYFDNFDYDISNVLPVQGESDNLQVRVRQMRLNHRPYTYRINVQSERAQDVVVRVYMGPRYDEQGREIPLNENRVNFIQLDQFVQSLQAGSNVVVRNSQQARYLVRDRTSYRTLYQRVMNALQGQEEFHLDMSEAHDGFPNRMMLPRGTVNGQVYQLYVYIGAYQPAQQQSTFDNVISAGVGSGSRYLDALPLGYPLERQINCTREFFVPNSYMMDVTVYHRAERDINASVLPVQQH